MPNLPQGKFAAVSDTGGRIAADHRDLKLDGPVMLEMTIFYTNGFDGSAATAAGSWHRERWRCWAESAVPRRSAGASTAPDSMADADLRATVFRDGSGCTGAARPTPIATTCRGAGQTVRLRMRPPTTRDRCAPASTTCASFQSSASGDGPSSRRTPFEPRLSGSPGRARSWLPPASAAFVGDKTVPGLEQTLTCTASHLSA